MLLNFTKMHGLGNDFMVIDLVTQEANITPKHIRRWANRHTGVGFDQLLIVEPPNQPNVDFCYRIFNADGSEVEQCGNGARCFAHFVRSKRLTSKKSIRVETSSGIIELHILPNHQIRVNMGEARFNPTEIPFKAPQQNSFYTLPVNNQDIEIMAVSIGNPHAVIRTDDIKQASVTSLGAQIEVHEQFPNRVNVGFIQIINRQHAKLRVWERSVGETNACGTGACAAAVASIARGWLDSPVTIELSGGNLNIEWDGHGSSIFMTGNAVKVYEGRIQV